MKKILSNICIIATQCTIVLLFMILMLNDENKTTKVIENNNLNKTTDKVANLFVANITAQTLLNDDKEVVELNNAIKEEAPVVEIPVEDEKKVPEEAPVDEEPSYLSVVDTSKYTSKEDKGFVVTIDNKTYSYDNEDLDFIIACVCAEAEIRNGSPDDALAVISVVLNRVESSKWGRNGDAIGQLKASGQFAVYSNESYLQYMPTGSRYNGNHYIIVKQAVMDALNGVRNNSYLGFNAWSNTNYSDNYLFEEGNRFR